MTNCMQICFEPSKLPSASTLRYVGWYYSIASWAVSTTPDWAGIGNSIAVSWLTTQAQASHVTVVLLCYIIRTILVLYCLTSLVQYLSCIQYLFMISTVYSFTPAALSIGCCWSCRRVSRRVWSTQGIHSISAAWSTGRGHVDQDRPHSA